MAQRTRSIIAHHLILTLYGHWGANDPRGSGSRMLRENKLEPLGPIHHGRKAEHLQPMRAALRAYHQAHEDLLDHPVLWIDEARREVIADAFMQVIRDRGYTCYACAILSNHAHLVIRIHRDDALTVMLHLMDTSGRRLRLRVARISEDHPIWASRPYKVFLYTPADVRSRIAYIERNPRKERLPDQAWDFVSDYDNWPEHKQRDRTA